ncbi:serine hydrolase domain-containing protein [Tamlana crocina]|uniref:Beta-lactamase family protein n=1 Tax=Tamlana crocina TaxID=393006 RepID=A0ABX1DG12_9FLAO|nr:serine hydrolase domain-containing protein [Tamlana crocina]NJX16684.1 beta-lactamase family protein [Tamlana crocina]
MKHLFLALIFLVGLSAIAQQTTETTIKQRFKTELEKDNIKSGLLHVYSESRNIDIQLVESKEDSISLDHPFYTASITKMLTATSTGILKDMRQLDFDDKISQFLPEPLMNKLHLFNGKDYTKEITIGHLLQHTSGLPDYFTDKTIDGSANIINQLLVDTDKFWTPYEMIEFIKKKMKPHFIPGQGYHYTDTEYVLLALIIENVSGLSFNAFLKKHIFQPLAMNDSYINLKSSAIKNQFPIAKFYVGDIELSSIKSLSADWGGGGLVSTTKDLITFLEAFNADKVVKKNTRLEMQNWIDESVGMEYGFGIRKVSYKDENKKLTLIGHTGSTSSFFWYCPELDTYIAGTLNQLEASKITIPLVYDVLKIIEGK